MRCPTDRCLLVKRQRWDLDCFTFSKKTSTQTWSGLGWFNTPIFYHQEGLCISWRQLQYDIIMRSTNSFYQDIRKWCVYKRHRLTDRHADWKTYGHTTPHTHTHSQIHRYRPCSIWNKVNFAALYNVCASSDGSLHRYLRHTCWMNNGAPHFYTLFIIWFCMDWGGR